MRFVYWMPGTMGKGLMHYKQRLMPLVTVLSHYVGLSSAPV